MKRRILLSLLCLLNAGFIQAQIVSSGKVTVHINNKPKITENTDNIVFRQPGTDALTKMTGKFYALIIGINDYIDPNISSLEKPIRDAEIFYNAITTRYTFDNENVKLLRNATNAEMVEALDFFAKKIRPEDNFLIFYAGHGVWEAEAENGYWLPSDAQRNSKLAWFRNSTLRDYLREIKSKHTLLISDACFGGSIFKARAAFSDASVAINMLYDMKSRKAMTSGTYNEVPDESVFLKYLVIKLLDNKEKYLSSSQLFSSFQIAVTNNSKSVPQFGVIQDVDDEGGDFIFILRE
jgi:hypothetical protein